MQGYPLAIIVCGVPSEAWVRPYDGKGMVDTDTAIVATHMLLEAADLGLGSCWMTRFDPSVVRELFRIPEGIEPEHILSIGYAAENAHPSERHTSRKPLADLVVEESFRENWRERPFLEKGASKPPSPLKTFIWSMTKREAHHFVSEASVSLKFRTQKDEEAFVFLYCR